MAQQAAIRIEAAGKGALGPALATKGRILALIDNDDQWHPAIDRLIETLAGSARTEVLLLNVQPKPNEMQTRGLFKEAISARLRERGQEMLAPAERLLHAAGIPFASRVKLADGAEEIVRCAHEGGCSSIVVAMPRLSGLRRTWVRTTGLAGSMASQLAELADMPVLVVHPEDH